MSTEMTWVHGNCGHLQEIADKWGEWKTTGWGSFLEGKPQDPDNHDEPWVHFHIPLTSQAVESAHQWPRLRAVLLELTTDYLDPIPDPEWVFESDNYYKYPMSDGGAFITQLHLFDGHNRFFAEDSLHWHSAAWDAWVVERLPLPQEIEIRHGLGVSVRVRFEHPRLTQRLAAHPVGDKSSAGKPVKGSKPLKGLWSGDVSIIGFRYQRCFISSVGCEYVPAAP